MSEAAFNKTSCFVGIPFSMELNSAFSYITSLQVLSMLLLTTQQTIMPILVRTASNETIFIASTSVFMMEVLKICTCLILIAAQEKFYWKSLSQRIHDEFWVKAKDSLKVGVPALIYAVQNNLYYLALSNIDATTFTLRILTTAVLAIVILGKRLFMHQWVALTFSLIGVVAVQISGESNSLSVKGSWFIGVAATITMCWTSAFAGVYFEKMLKERGADMYTQNMRLGLMTLLFAGGAMLLNDGQRIKNGGFFQGWTPLVWFITILNSVAGLAISAVMKYADNVKKTYCQSMAIGLTALLSISLGERSFTFGLVGGILLVLVSFYAYAVWAPGREKTHKMLETKNSRVV